MIHEVSADQYHDDQLDNETPSLSRSTIHQLISRSPAHAWQAHPRLNPNFRRLDEQKFDIGTAAHALLLQGDDVMFEIDAPDWRRKDVRESRDIARAQGRVPLLSKHVSDVRAMVAAIRAQLEQHEAEPPLFTDGSAEVTLTWHDAGVLCRARLDWLRADLLAIDDLKTTAGSARPQDYARRIYDTGGDIQAAFYLRGLAVHGYAQPRAARFRWVVIENTPPYALSVIEPSPAVLEIANLKIDKALELWKACLEADEWPAYSTRVATAELPPWEESRALEELEAAI